MTTQHAKSNAREGDGVAENDSGLVCPFCSDDDFDPYGLQFHLQAGHCPNFGQYDRNNNLPDGAPR